ncbi:MULTISPECIES: RNA polymerase sigma factor [Lysobacter]|uniref:RNA polymerase sigma factor n=1 Tax=Lysobacter TaxID=68 RepID=UPI001F25DA8C|nr:MULTISPECIES: RNA polymerase sigma factor [Lysobacter]UJB18737.1 RNA polymerase sigma factor [Lysobacter capsici]UJQ27538.1 RNA polymerase sigma factor [Lysobacter gummosus]
MSIVPELTTNDHAFERFLGEERAPLINFLRSHGASQDDAQDVTQESLHKLIRYRAVPLYALKPLLYRIALNQLCDIRRRESSLRRSLQVAGLDTIAAPIDVPLPEQWAEHREELARVKAAIERLPERCRQVYLLNRIDGMSYSQISAHQGISVKAVEKHISRALTLLRQLLATQTQPMLNEQEP